MSDIALTWDPVSTAWDFSIVANDLATDDGLRTAILLSLFLDRQAEPGDELPEGETDRRGWWADVFAHVPGDKIGSRLWLLDRAKPVPLTLARAKEYAAESLKWLTDDAVVSSVTASAEFLTKPRGLAVIVDVLRPGALEFTRFRFDRVWAAEAARV